MKNMEFKKSDLFLGFSLGSFTGMVLYVALICDWKSALFWFLAVGSILALIKSVGLSIEEAIDEAEEGE